MTRIRFMSVAIAIAVVTTGCSRQPADPAAINTTEAPAPPPVTGIDSVPASGPNTANPAAAFPTAMQGRWGLVPADCTSQKGDNKGLITIDATSIRFYESIAKIGAVKQVSDTDLSASLAYDGEGMQWQHDAKLQVKPETGQLVMEEFGADAVPGPRTYTRCK